jgi:DNA-binding beta-propeller fold protein YncE
MAAYSPGGVLYMASSVTDELYTVDTSAQTFTSVATINKSLSGTDIAFAADGTLYLISTESSNNKALYTVDPSDGSVTKKGTGTGEQFTGLAVQDAGTGNLVGSATSDDSVYVIERDGDLGTQFPMEVPDGSGGFEDYNYDFGDMTASHICGEVFHQGTLKQDLGRLTQDPPVPLDGNRATPFDEFAPGNTGADSNRECFQPSMTHYIGFGWWVPEDVGNEIQGDSVNFDPGLHTPQCRPHDGTSAG